jgi:hypothetical protein
VLSEKTVTHHAVQTLVENVSKRIFEAQAIKCWHKHEDRTRQNYGH